jgi:hypothetical protein
MALGRGELHAPAGAAAVELAASEEDFDAALGALAHGFQVSRSSAMGEPAYPGLGFREA